MSTEKRRLWDAGLLGRAAKKKPYLRLANKNKRLRWAKKSQLRLVFCGYYLMKLPVEDL